MPWIPHLMVLDDDPRVLDSLVPGFATELARGLGKCGPVVAALRRGEPPGGAAAAPIHLKVSAHGFESERLTAFRSRSPHHVHLHLVRERGGRFDLARRLLNEQLFAVVVSDLRFADDAGGQRAGHLFIDEVQRVHPEVHGLLYSAYPRPDDFPADRFVRKGPDGDGGPSLAELIVAAVERHLADPAVAAFAEEIAEQGLISQSDAFGTTLAQVFALARLLGTEANAGHRNAGRARRPLPCLLLEGESGTGKRGLAALFHAASDRRKAPLAVAACNELTNETLLRSILFGHKRGAFTDAREDRPGLVAAAGKGVLLLDDFHRLPTACSAILHSFLEDGEYSRLGEEEVRRHAEAAAVLTVETAPWQERRRSGELPLAFLARVERLPLHVPPLRERPDDIEAQARWLTRAVAAEVGADVELTDDAVQNLRVQPFAESNSRELRNAIERAIYRQYRETDRLDWPHLRPFLPAGDGPTAVTAPVAAPSPAAPSSPRNEWQRRLRALAAKVLAKGLRLEPEEADALATTLFDEVLPHAWSPVEAARSPRPDAPPIPLPVWEDLWRCFAVSRLGGPSPAEKALGIPANTLRQWINDREAR
ncbi:MAG TPA: sigma 54-interacting transcriptional regulator [Isosphaeraceae bacterium]|jgi:transcriptional regulator with AAA-type ATPase domain|nr:sigma 54-interacting transcriptional regulator [Isosphaeraceae bacterium]